MNWPRVFLNSIDGFAFTLFVSESSFDCFYLVFGLLDMTVLFSFSPSINEKYKVLKSHLCFYLPNDHCQVSPLTNFFLVKLMIDGSVCRVVK